MPKVKKHPTKKWEVSIMALKGRKGKKFKVTRRIPSMTVSETKTFKSKKWAMKQFNEWLS